MHFLHIGAATLALVGAALAAPIIAARNALQFTNINYEGIAVGTAVPIMWSGNVGAVTVNLKSGEASDLQTATTIAADVWGTGTSWIPTNQGTYAFEIMDTAGNVNYSPQFTVGA